MKNPVWRIFLALLFISVCGNALAKGPRISPEDADGRRMYLIELADPSLVRFDGRNALQLAPGELQATSPVITGKRLNVRSPAVQAYDTYLERRFELFRGEAALALGRAPLFKFHIRNVMNGTATRLTEAEAETLRSHPMVRSVNVEEIHQLSTDVGPEWIGAAAIWDGTSGFSANEGEGVVVGIIDSGIAWDHDSFADPAPSPDFHNHVNPFGEQIGLCSDAEVLCNNKLIGVWDFTDEETKGKDSSGHGSNVAGIAVGNRHTVGLDIGSGVETFTLKGVAPHANLVTYKVCREDDPETPDEDEDGCPTTGIVQAINQAVTDGVDVVNFSIGSGPANPWSGYAMLFLEMRDAGIFAVTSNGNEGPVAGSTGYPAVAPWLMGAGAASHSRIIGARLTDLSGGGTPPGDFVGTGKTPVNGSVNGYGPAEIVFAGDYGNALCGQGQPELQSSCNAHTGSTNPFPDGTFNGEIVVCQRGNYGRIEKGFNVMQAGAGGFILINAELDGNSTNADNHCIPGIHLTYGDGLILKDWLDPNVSQTARIDRFDLLYDDGAGDLMADFSARGPNAAVPDVLKPNVITPGRSIIGASDNAGSYWLPSGTSMSSPHVAGAAALLLGVHSDWSVSAIASALEITASASSVKDIDGSDATPHVRGSGRVVLGDAANAGLSLEISTAEFTDANPVSGGVPKDLNLVGLVDSDCFASCSLTRTVTDLMGGGNWTVSTEGFPAGVDVSVTPSSFSLANGASRSLDIEFDLIDAPAEVGSWVYGDIVLSASGAPDARLTAAVFSAGGDLPQNWIINSADNSGFDELVVNGTVGMPDATYTAGGLVAPTLTTETLQQDPTDDEIYDGPPGVMTEWITVPEGGLWLHTETLASTATDLDLYVGRDVDGDGLAEESEELCSSTTPDDLELCDLLNPVPGEYWVIVQNWLASGAGSDEATLKWAVVAPGEQARLTATGPGIVGFQEPVTVRSSWENVNALPGEEWLGAVGLGADRSSPNNMGVIPVYFSRSGISAPQTLPLIDGEVAAFALPASDKHDLTFIDVPPGVSRLNVSATGADAAQNDGLTIELHRMGFDTAFDNLPFAAPLPGGSVALATASGSGGVGPSLAQESGLDSGRFYVVVSNANGSASAVEVTATLEMGASPVPLNAGLWQPKLRDSFQGYEYNNSGGFRAMLWYTYDKDGNATWYISSNPAPSGNTWSADLLRVTNDGTRQQELPVGRVSITVLSESESVFTTTLFGESASEMMKPSGRTCPDIGGVKSYTGAWSRTIAGLGGASMQMNVGDQGHIHYLFDDVGNPRWLLAFLGDVQPPEANEMPINQFTGYCAVCTESDVSFDPVGVFTRTFSDESTASWTLDYLLNAPLSGSVIRTDSVVKLTNTLVCE